MSVIDDTITRLQQLALLSADTTIKSAPQTPPDSASVLPMSVAWISGGSVTAVAYGDVKMFLTIRVDIHVNLKTLKSAYTQINGIIPDFLRRLCGDPDLNGEVSTITFPVSVEVSPMKWNNVDTLMAAFTVPVKVRTETL
jgi:hypothetical protein